MKSTPPLAPNCPLFRVRKYDSKVCFLCPSTLVRSRVSGLEEVLEVPIEDLWPSALWRLIMCGVQEVAWLKEADRIGLETSLDTAKHDQAHADACENSRAWRERGEQK